MKRLVRAFAASSIVLFAGVVNSAIAQQSNVGLYDGGRLRVNQPAGIAGVRQITTSSSSGWGGALSSPLVNYQVVRALGTANGNTDSLYCSTSANGTGGIPVLTGNKVAILFRGDCQFSEKAFRAQQAGAAAVIIVNNIPGAPVGMASGTNGAQVTIPVVMVSDVVGQAMVNSIRGGATVTVTLGQWSLGLPADIGIAPFSAAMPHARAIPASQFTGNNPVQYRMYTGGVFSNFGTSTQTDIKLNSTITWTPASGTGSTVFTDSATFASLTPQDSSEVTTSPRFYNPTSSAKGRYDLSTRVSSTTGDADTSDNTSRDFMVLTDTIFSKGEYNFTTNRPVAASSIRPGGTTPPAFSFGPLFYVNKGGQFARTLQFTMSAGSGVSLDQKTTNVTLFKWKDGTGGNNADGVMQEGELTLLGIGQKSFTTADSGFFDYKVNFQKPQPTSPAVRLDDTSWYWTSASSDGSLFIGVDANTNAYTRSLASKRVSGKTEYTAPRYDSDPFAIPNIPGVEFRMFPFNFSSPSGAATTDVDSIFVDQSGLIPAMALHVSNFQAPVGVATPNVGVKGLELFPNPTTGDVSIKWTSTGAAPKMTYTIYSGLGQAVLMASVPQSAGTNNLKVSMGQLPAGNYWIVLGSEEGLEARTIVLSK